MTKAQTSSVHDDIDLAKPAPDLDRLLAPRPHGYLGADVALSLSLNDGRTLWIFGDTLVGEIQNGRRAWNGMPRNSVAIQSAADSNSVEWTLAGPDGAWRDFFRLPADANADKWFWATAGAMIDGELFVIGYRVTSAPGECEALSFRLVDTWLMRVRDVSGPPSQWRIEPAPLPFGAEGAWFGSSALAVDNHLYLIGFKSVEGESYRRLQSVLARTSISEIKAHGAQATFEFWSGATGAESWVPEPVNLAPLFEPGIAECTVLWDAPRRRFLATSYRPRRPEYLVTSAPAITGPWSPPVCVFHETAHTPSDDYLFYAFRFHPQLSADENEMVCTYVVNPRQVAKLEDDLTAYYPRFLSLDLSRI